MRSLKYHFHARSGTEQYQKMRRLIEVAVVLTMLMMMKSSLATSDEGLLQLDFYKETCPLAEEIIGRMVEIAVLKDPRMAASLLRLHFHDCFVLVINYPFLSLQCNTFDVYPLHI